MSWFHGALARLRLLFGGRAVESRMSSEFRFHIDMETERLMRDERLDASEARRRALAAFGGVEAHKEAIRDGRGRSWFDGFALDLKLGARMLVKYPGLTLVGGLAMGFAIAVGAVIFEVVTLLLYPTLPLPNGDRIVQIRNLDTAANTSDARALHDFVIWRGALRSITELGAWRDLSRNLIVAPGDSALAVEAQMTASGFRIAQGAPVLGRVFTEADEQAAAPLVVVLGHHVWRTRFGSDPSVIGRTVQLGNDTATVVGVMPDGFGFPIAHELWTPLRIQTLKYGPRSGPPITVFGMVAPGATFETAQAELTTLGRSVAVENPATHEHLQPQLRAYPMLYAAPSGDAFGILFSVNVFAVLLLILICSNVALLLFARAATREAELVVRTALGATRARIVVQLFAEALVLGSVAAVAGLVFADFVLTTWGVTFLETNLGRLPFWYDIGISPTTVLFAIGLTLLGSTVAGVLPALKVTRGMGSRLKQATAGAGGLQFGGVWTAVIVLQVAVTVAFPGLVYVEQWQLRRAENFPAGFAAEEYLAARIQMDMPAVADAQADAAREAQRAKLALTIGELRRRIEASPGVTGITFIDRLPRMTHADPEIELQDDWALNPQAKRTAATGRLPVREVNVAGIDPSYFDVLEAPILAGRAFQPADLSPGVQVAIVDQGFVDVVMEGRNPIGQRVRFAESGPNNEPGPWIEVIGVVRELGMTAPSEKSRAAGFYLPASPERLNRLYMMIHVPGDPLAFAPQLREIATAIDPGLRLTEVQRVDQVTEDLIWIVRLWLKITLMMTAVALLLSLAGIYAVLSFIVARRTREIGIRVALGASRTRVVFAIFRRPLIQVSLGILAGITLIGAATSMAYRTEFPGADSLSAGLTPTQAAMLLGHATLMLGVCMLACLVPTRRALNVEPTTALRVD